MITPSKITKVQTKIKAALAAIAAEENVTISFGNSRYNDSMYYTKMTVATILPKKEAMSQNEKLSRSVGFTQNVIGMSFKYKSSIMEIVEIRTRNPKNPVIGKTKSGSCYKFTVEQAKRFLGGDKLINREANLNKLV